MATHSGSATSEGLAACVGHEGLPSGSARLRILTPWQRKEIKIASVSFGGERFIVQQVEPGSWSILDRRHRELVGSNDNNHERAEQRAAALNATNARRHVEGRQLGRRERDKLNASLQTELA
jgi:hypothetical protein